MPEKPMPTEESLRDNRIGANSMCKNDPTLAFDRVSDMAYEPVGRTLQEWTPSQLHAYCRESRPDHTHELYCFELFRRAIAEKSEQCWAAIYAQYKNLVYRWALTFAKSNEPIGEWAIEDLVVDAFTAFWRAYTAEKLTHAESLGSILRYLKSCVATTVLQAQRKVGKAGAEIPWDAELIEAQSATTQAAGGVEQLIFQEVGAVQLWAIVDTCCHDDKERIIARNSFVLDLKPSTIIEAYPGLFTDVAEIYTIRRNLKNRLWRSEQLRALVEEGHYAT